MNYIWGFMIFISLLYSAANGTLSETVEAGFNGSVESVYLVLSFTGIMCLWSGLLKACEYAGISSFLKKLISPVLNFLFPKLSKGDKAREYITENICANLLGMGNGATPAGINAMCSLAKGQKKATDEMCMFAVLNTAAFQLIPTTILALRTTYGSENSFKIIIPVWIASFASLSTAVISVKIMQKIKRKEQP